MFSFTLLEGDGVNYVPFEPSDQSEWTSNTVIFEKYSPFNATTLMKEFDKIQGSHGTRIILFNLRKRENEDSHLYELDFCTWNDIRISDHTAENTRKHRGPVFQQNRDGQLATTDVPEDYSMKAYMEILYLRPRCAFYLRGEKSFRNTNRKVSQTELLSIAGTSKETPSCAASTFTTKIV